MGLFICTGVTLRVVWDGIEYQIQRYVIVNYVHAGTLPEACQAIERSVMAQYPPEAGFGHHRVNVAQIPEPQTVAA